MSPAKQKAERPPSEESRRSLRFPLLVLLDVKWSGPDGATVVEKAEATEVNAFGGLIHMPRYPLVGDTLELFNPGTREHRKGKLVALRRNDAGATTGGGCRIFQAQ